MGGSDVVHYVQVSLTGTTVARVLECMLEGGMGFVWILGTYFVHYYVDNVARSNDCTIMGPCPGNVARGILPRVA